MFIPCGAIKRARQQAPASAAFESYSPSAKAGSWTQKNDTQFEATINSVTYSGAGGRVTDLRTCNWVPDNDDECSRWEIRG
ncbi:hypothetical protein ACWGJW_01730 [Streptomyces nigrescens]